MHKIILFSLLSLSIVSSGFAQMAKDVQPTVSKALSPKKAVILSAVMPGAGQLYSKHTLSAAVYAALELSGISLYYYNSTVGNRKVGEYEDYADENWDIHRWFEGDVNNAGYYANISSNPSTHTIFIISGNKRYDFHQFLEKYPTVSDLPDDYRIEEEYHFYENIGKYEQFKQGWADYSDNSEFETDRRFSPLQADYAFLRENANDYLKMATTFSTALMFNHFISAIDAGFRAKKSKENQNYSLKLQMLPILGFDNSGGMLNVSIKL